MPFQNNVNTVDNIKIYVYVQYSLKDSALTHSLTHSAGTTSVNKLLYSKDRVASGDGRSGLVS
jgi:hypothetical protein